MNIRDRRTLPLTMGVLGTITALGMAITLGGWARPAIADPFSGPPICSSAGMALSGSHGNLTITGNAYVASGTTLTVSGNLTLAPGACLDAFTVSTVIVSGNVLVGRGAFFALGCTPTALKPTVPPCFTSTTHDVVGGSILAELPLGLLLGGDRIFGSVISYAGGDPTLSNPALVFAVEDNTIGRDLVVYRWQGAWFGALRNTVGGSVFLSGNVGTRLGMKSGMPDSTEVGSNIVIGNLICLHNMPAAQIGDSPTGPNTVFGRKKGECAQL